MLQKNEKNIKIESDKVGERTEEKEGESECERMAMAERERANNDNNLCSAISTIIQFPYNAGEE